MRTRTGLVAIVAFAALGMTACGSENAGTSEQSAGTPTSMSTAELQSRLLSAKDLGTDWRLGEAINPADLAAFAQLPCEGTTLDATTAKRLTANAGVQFEPTDRSYKGLIELVVTGDSAQLDRDLQLLFGAIESCPGSSPSSGGTVTVKKLTAGALGDQRAVYASTQAGPAGAKTVIYTRMGYVRVGTVAVALGLADFQATAPGESQISDATYARLLETAVAKFST